MRKKLIYLTLALGSLGAAHLFGTSDGLGVCRLVCCPDTGCFVCCRPCVCV